MHIFFSGIGGAGISSLALIAQQAGYQVSGSDAQDTSYIHTLQAKGVDTITVGDQSYAAIANLHKVKPIDWYVYSSAIADDAPELQFCRDNDIQTSKRDELLNQILHDHNLNLIAIAGTHGKTTTTSMMIWLFTNLGVPISYSVGAKISFGDTGAYVSGSKYFIYEADEFDRNFLHFNPHLSLISGVSWDHHEVFPTRDDYQQAFRDFIAQSSRTLLWDNDHDYLSFSRDDTGELLVQDSNDIGLTKLTLKGPYNRRDAWLAIKATNELLDVPMDRLITIMNDFPGAYRRMERIAPGLYSDYAHTPEKIRGAMSVALEMAAESKQPLVVIYEPLTNRRQHYMRTEYNDCFNGASALYWTPTYLAREDSNQPVLKPIELIAGLTNQEIAQPAILDDGLMNAIEVHLAQGDMVVGMAGGGGGSLDDWLRQKFGS